jgi:hypothetical protein
MRCSRYGAKPSIVGHRAIEVCQYRLGIAKEFYFNLLNRGQQCEDVVDEGESIHGLRWAE